MSQNKKLVEAHMAATPGEAAEMLSDDFEWIEWAHETGRIRDSVDPP